LFFLDYPDLRQLIKVIYPLDEALLLSLLLSVLAVLAVLAGAETFTDIARFGENKLICCDGSDRISTRRRLMTGWGRSSLRSMPSRSSSVL
jgi:hypothetical protein